MFRQDVNNSIFLIRQLHETNENLISQLISAYVIFLNSDTICELGGASELANYGEYSGAPTESQTYQYAMTILRLLTDGEPRPDGKSLSKSCYVN